MYKVKCAFCGGRLSAHNLGSRLGRQLHTQALATYTQTPNPEAPTHDNRS